MKALPEINYKRGIIINFKMESIAAPIVGYASDSALWIYYNNFMFALILTVQYLLCTVEAVLALLGGDLGGYWLRCTRSVTNNLEWWSAASVPEVIVIVE